MRALGSQALSQCGSPTCRLPTIHPCTRPFPSLPDRSWLQRGTLTTAFSGPSASESSLDGDVTIDRAAAAQGHGVLRLAEHDLSAYCSSLYEGDETERCWLAYQYFEDRKAEAEGGCDIEIKDGVVNGVNCNRLDHFEDFIRQMIKEGKVRNMAKTLATLAGAERRQSQRASGEGPVTLRSLVDDLDSQAPENVTPAKDAFRAVLADIFNQHDYNKDGRMDAQEFRDAMKSMGDELSAKSVQTIFTAMDIHGWMTFDEFVQIVEAEEVRAHSRFAKGLRALARNSSHWWTELPNSVGQLL